MAQGQAIQALKRAYDVSRDQKYLDTANALLNSFFVEVKEGGVTYKTERDGWWYEEYASNGRVKESRVLNGMMYAMLGIYEYYEFTGHEDAKYLFDQGVFALKKNLPRYDANGYSYYDILEGLALQYHNVHIELLERLYHITKEEHFREYHDRWQSYKEPLSTTANNFLKKMIKWVLRM